MTKRQKDKTVSASSVPSRLTPVLPVSVGPSVVVIGDSDEDEDAAQESAQHYESDATVGVDDQFRAAEKLRGEVSVNQCLKPKRKNKHKRP